MLYIVNGELREPRFLGSLWFACVFLLERALILMRHAPLAPDTGYLYASQLGRCEMAHDLHGRGDASQPVNCCVSQDSIMLILGLKVCAQPKQGSVVFGALTQYVPLPFAKGDFFRSSGCSRKDEEHPLRW